MSQSNTPALSIENVVKNYGPVQALQGVSFDVKKGEVFGLLGPNGAGKTSLISIIVTLEKATHGRARVFGHDVSTHPREAKLNLGWVSQEIINSGFFDVEEILKFHAGYYGVSERADRIEYILKGLSLWEHRKKKVKQLSGGMKRRLMIAKALVHEPGLLLLDEPTAGVDVELRMKLWDFVEELKGKGLSILLTTHYLEEAERLCDRVAIIHKGQIRAIGGTRMLIEEWSRKKVTLRLTEPVQSLMHPDLVKGSGQEWVFLTAMTKTLGELLQELKLNSAHLNDVKVDEGSLEDVFMRLTQEGKA
ncbi:MAG: ABC transporter ATP-binding protein [Bdellovibrionales bacterium]|nr:ABC transporter ATP-binding protein [Bdellovibrionales bacterium]